MIKYLIRKMGYVGNARDPVTTVRWVCIAGPNWDCVEGGLRLALADDADDDLAHEKDYGAPWR